MSLRTWDGPQWKKGRTALKKAKQKLRRERVKKETDAKALVRKRDRHCRFPRCGCRKLGLALKAFGEVSHATHKGMGGDPTGVRSTTATMVLLCKHRHQDGAISRHRGTLRHRPLTSAGFDGPVAWDIDRETLSWGTPMQNVVWAEVAREKAVGQLEPLEPWQRDVLDELANMEV